MSQNNGVYRTQSMAIAAYLHRVRRGEYGIWIKSSKRISGPEKFEFVFSDPEHKANEIAVEFSNSDCALFDDGMRSIKTLLSRPWDI